VWDFHLLADSIQFRICALYTHLYIFLAAVYYYTYLPLSRNCVRTVVVTNAWSERPFNVNGSHCIFYDAEVDMIRSIQDCWFPFLKVLQAGVPGYSPFSMYSPCYSQRVISHVALAFTI